MLDSVRKKTDFLELVKSELGLNNIEVINGRAEEIIKDRREKYDDNGKEITYTVKETKVEG